MVRSIYPGFVAETRGIDMPVMVAWRGCYQAAGMLSHMLSIPPMKRRKERRRRGTFWRHGGGDMALQFLFSEERRHVSLPSNNENGDLVLYAAVEIRRRHGSELV